jgi:hypothetical protein
MAYLKEYYRQSVEPLGPMLDVLLRLSVVPEAPSTRSETIPMIAAIPPPCFRSSAL